MDASPKLLVAKDIWKQYGTVQVLKGVSLELEKGELVSIVGASGAGKSTLLYIVSSLEKADQGSIYYQGQSIHTLSNKELANYRNKHIGFVFQFHHLLPEFTALENVAMPLRIRGMDKLAAQDKARKMLARLGLAQRENHSPGMLSGGERQRVAVARALVGEPSCVLADEPTGNLDSETADRVFDLMLDIARQQGTAFLIVTHDPIRAKRCDRILHLERGVLKPFAG